MVARNALVIALVQVILIIIVIGVVLQGLIVLAHAVDRHQMMHVVSVMDLVQAIIVVAIVVAINVAVTTVEL